MRNAFARVSALTVLTLLVASASFAQMGGGGQSSQFREEHKYTFQLMQMVHHIELIGQNPKYALTAAQAKQALAVLKPLSTKQKLTQDQAKQALKDLKKVFTVTQLNAMAKIKPPKRMGARPGGPGGPGGPGSPRGPQGDRPRWDPASMKDFNPFYTKVSKSDPMAMGRVKRTTDFIKSLEKKSKQTKPTKAPAKSTKAPAKSGAKK